jgi:hypothetical protein
MVRNDLISKYRICPTFGENGNTENMLKIILKSPNNSTPIEEYDEGYQSNVLDIEGAAGMTPVQFYNLFIQTEKPICFNALPSVFP